MDQQHIDRITKLVLQELGQEASQAEFTVPVGVSARHVHLTQEHVEQLFGPGSQLTKYKELMGGQFAANEQVTIVGPKKSIEGVRVLGPVRKGSQVEVSWTDARTLGVSAPIRDSGDTKGSAAITMVGPKGAVYLAEGCIVASRHVHMSPADAQKAGVQDGQMLNVRLGCHLRSAMLEHVKARVDPTYTLEMHIDTDEANAIGVKTGDVGVLIPSEEKRG